MRRRAVGDEQGDPVWAMVLELCAARLEGREVSVTSLCLASGLPVTTALRRLDELEHDGRITRSPDKNDRRRVFVALKSEFHDRLLEQLVAMARVRSEFSFTE
ncbi:MarR family transcriptional regulator [Rhizobiales bacterium TNE-4]|nr:MarR family transcriptional regulator [Rhizobiales bacterium TNE-4]MBV1827730.1 MarR family transcriptional regulator [Rhizobiales bacterium TNE-4]